MNTFYNLLKSAFFNTLENILLTCLVLIGLTLWGRVTHICISNLAIIGSDNGLSPGRCQAIIWTNAGILLIGPLGKNSETSIAIQTFSLKKMHLNMSSVKWLLFCLSQAQCVKSSKCVAWNIKITATRSCEISRSRQISSDIVKMPFVLWNHD